MTAGSISSISLEHGEQTCSHSCAAVFLSHAGLFVTNLLNSFNRVKKLRETLVAVQQLDKNMSSLRSWLAHIETELSKPIAYDSCDAQEIQRKLDLQQVT